TARRRRPSVGEFGRRRSCRRRVEGHRAETTLPPVPDQVDLSTTRVRTEDWPAQATDTIVKVVGTASDKVTGPVTTAARAIVFGLFAGILGTAAVVLVSILVVRVLNNYLPDSVFGEEHVWAAHLLIGLVFSGLALVLWSKRKPQPSER
ncbi:MAG: hypothetical protein QOI98_3495, partial [Solirubrobacteraceae bacterium]|nr:hypothetical protein [Solirubrobacteraceae bacterium]